MIPRPAASATSGGAGGSKPGALACRDVTVTKTGLAAQYQNLRNRKYTSEPNLRLRLPISYKLNIGGRFF